MSDAFKYNPNQDTKKEQEHMNISIHGRSESTEYINPQESRSEISSVTSFDHNMSSNMMMKSSSSNESLVKITDENLGFEVVSADSPEMESDFWYNLFTRPGDIPELSEI